MLDGSGAAAGVAAPSPRRRARDGAPSRPVGEGCVGGWAERAADADCARGRVASRRACGYSRRWVIAFSTAWVRSRQSSFTSSSEM